MERALIRTFPFSFIKQAKRKVQADPVREDLILRIRETQTRIHVLQAAFERETDFDMIEAYIYEIDGVKKQYSHLIKQAKAQLS